MFYRNLINGDRDVISELAQSIGSPVFMEYYWSSSQPTLPNRSRTFGLYTSSRRVTQLAIVSENIQTLPDSICQLKALRKLILRSNRLSSLPDAFANLKELRILDLRNNRFQAIPTVLWPLEHLADLLLLPNPFPPNEQTIAQRPIPYILDYLKKRAVINIFISHTGEDYQEYRIAELAQYLEEQAEVNKAYYFERDMNMDGNLRNFMTLRVPESRILIFIFTPNSVDSEACRYELQLARTRRRKIIPILGAECDFSDLQRLELGDEVALKFYDYEFEEFLRFLYNSIIQYKRNHANELLDAY